MKKIFNKVIFCFLMGMCYSFNASTQQTSEERLRDAFPPMRQTAVSEDGTRGAALNASYSLAPAPAPQTASGNPSTAPSSDALAQPPVLRRARALGAAAE